MRYLLAIALAMLGLAQARGHQVTTCDKAHIGLESLSKATGKTSRTFANGSIRVFDIDTEEPVACAEGIAVVFEATKEPGTHCFYVGCFASVSEISTAAAVYDSKRGLLLRLKFGDYGADRPLKPTKDLKIRIDRGAETVSIEK